MAVVESAADSLALSVPTLGLALPRSYGHISTDTDQPAKIQLHNANQHFESHVHQFNHPPILLPQIKTSQSTHIDEDQKLQRHSGSSPTPTDAPGLVNGDSRTFVDDLGDPALACTNGTSDKSATNNVCIERSASDNGLPTMLQMSPTNQSESAQGSATECETDCMRDLAEQMSKLNPLATEFVPSSSRKLDKAPIADEPKKKTSSSHGRRKTNSRTAKAQREESIRRTIYVSDIDQHVTEEHLASLFGSCGAVVDCRVCGDPNSVLRFAFVEFISDEAAQKALSLAGTMLGYYPVRILPSKTAIVPVNPSFLPRSEDERQLCARTVYCTNIDKKVSQADVKLFFEKSCGEVSRLRLLGDYRHSTRIAFVEFVRAESAMLALGCSGAVLGSLPLRVGPSKTPVRSRSPHCL